MLKQYYQLTKPGIIYGNLVTTAAGFLLASTHVRHFYIWLFTSTMIGTALVIASACVFNNYLDRGLDAKMARTKNRALVRGQLSAGNALGYATLLGIYGFYILAIDTNRLTVSL